MGDLEEDDVKMGQEVTVVLHEIDPQGRINLSRRALFGDNGSPAAGPGPHPSGPPPTEAGRAVGLTAAAPAQETVGRGPEDHREAPETKGLGVTRVAAGSWEVAAPVISRATPSLLHITGWS